jgi:integrase
VSIFQRRRGVWRITLEAGPDPLTGRRKRIYRDVRGTKEQAKDALAAWRTQVRVGLYVEPHKETMATFLERWLAYMEDRLAPAAFLSYREIVRKRLIPALGRVTVQQLQTQHVVEAERVWLREGRVSPARAGPRSAPGLSAKTVLNYHRVLVEALNYAVRWKVVAANVADDQHMQPPRGERKPVAVLSLDDARKLLDVLAEDRYGPVLHTLLATGLRVGEVLGLRWRQDVDLEAYTIRVQQQYDRVLKQFRAVKTHRSVRPIAIDVGLAFVLRKWRVRQAELKLKAGPLWCESGLVFTDNLGGHLTHDILRIALDRCLRQAELQHVTRHGLRHTHASLLIELGAHMKVVSERLGHASFGITADTYSHVSPAMQQQAARSFGEALSKA